MRIASSRLTAPRPVVERHADEALRGQVVHLVRTGGFDQADARCEVGEVVFDEGQVRMLLDAELGDPPEVDRAGPAKRARHAIALVEEQLRQVSAVLAGNAGDQGRFRSLHVLGISW
jgi:hypothetical protein